MHPMPASLFSAVRSECKCALTPSIKSHTRVSLSKERRGTEGEPTTLRCEPLDVLIAQVLAPQRGAVGVLHAQGSSAKGCCPGRRNLQSGLPHRLSRCGARVR